MIPQLPNLDGYIEVDGKQLRTPLQQIEKNKDDIEGISKIISVSPEPNSIPKRTEHGTISAAMAVNAGADDACATNFALLTGLGHWYFTPFWAETSEHPEWQTHQYKYYSNEAHGWTDDTDTSTGVITGIPNNPDDDTIYFGVRIINASNSLKTIKFRNCVNYDPSRYYLRQAVRIATQSATNLQAYNTSSEGLVEKGFQFDIPARSNVFVYGRTIYAGSAIRSQFFVI